MSGRINGGCLAFVRTQLIAFETGRSLPRRNMQVLKPALDLSANPDAPARCSECDRDCPYRRHETLIDVAEGKSGDSSAA